MFCIRNTSNRTPSDCTDLYVLCFDCVVSETKEAPKFVATQIVSKYNRGSAIHIGRTDPLIHQMRAAAAELRIEELTQGTFCLQPPLEPYVSFLPPEMDVMPYIKCAIAQANLPPVTTDFVCVPTFTEHYTRVYTNTTNT